MSIENRTCDAFSGTWSNYHSEQSKLWQTQFLPRKKLSVAKIASERACASSQQIISSKISQKSSQRYPLLECKARDIFSGCSLGQTIDFNPIQLTWVGV